MRDVEKLELCPEQNLDKMMDTLSHNMYALEIIVSLVLQNTIKIKNNRSKTEEARNCIHGSSK